MDQSSTIQAYLRIGTSSCGGSLVNHYHVITAAHCVAGATPDQLRIYLGEYTLNSEEEPFAHVMVGASQISVHPHHKLGTHRYDVAVITLSRRVPYQPHIKPICLPDKGDDFEADYAVVAGWGITQEGLRFVYPETLQAVSVKIINNGQCQSWYTRRGYDYRIHTEMVCAGFREGGKDACTGDSGGPLMLEDRGRWTLVGIVSWGIPCAHPLLPSVYHRVSATIDWISSVVWSLPKSL
ncbi:serine proteinase stubble-like [Artemia franciscana]|uniref:limulus clotting factor C n=1 Tax=Artemia franciscana TaxID=6661 RepID=A0AA88LED2_ARTSF|nr:hypothetical protein QYM36_005692 [Artemia franciscana]